MARHCCDISSKETGLPADSMIFVFFNLAFVFNYFVRVAVGIVLYLFLEFDQKSISGSYEIVFVQKIYNV